MSRSLLCFRVAGEWFNADPEAVISQALQTGAGPNVSDAYTINGLPGPLYNCSSQGIPCPALPYISIFSHIFYYHINKIIAIYE